MRASALLCLTALKKCYFQVSANLAAAAAKPAEYKRSLTAKDAEAAMEEKKPHREENNNRDRNKT